MNTTSPHLYLATNSQQPSLMLQAALCYQLPNLTPEGQLPEWVRLIPLGEVKGRDGRTWHNPTPEAVIANTKASNREQPLDYEHATDLKAPKGEPAPAAGWFTDYRLHQGFIEGRLNLNPNGLASVTNREYRYLSPVFRHTADGTIYDITSAALTNKPNLLLPALNQQAPPTPYKQPHNPTPQENPMTLEELLAALRAALGLGETATAEEALAAIEAAKTQSQATQAELKEAQNRQLPSLESYVPRGDYNALLTRATNAEQQLAQQAEKELETAINHEIEAALAAGKIAPASVDYHTTNCKREGGLAAFKAFVATAPALVGAGVTNNTPEMGSALNQETQTLAAVFGNTEDDLKTHGGLTAALT